MVLVNAIGYQLAATTGLVAPDGGLEGWVLVGAVATDSSVGQEHWTAGSNSSSR
jgi:hypothetical protein